MQKDEKVFRFYHIFVHIQRVHRLFIIKHLIDTHKFKSLHNLKLKDDEK